MGLYQPSLILTHFMGHIGPPGKRRNAPGGPMCPTRKGRALFFASGVARRLRYPHRGATRSYLATKIAAVKWVNIKDGWYFSNLPGAAIA